MNGLQLKRLEIEDIDYMKDILENNIEYNTENLKNFIIDENNYGFIGIKDNKAIAFLYGYGLLRPDGRNMFYIHSVDVLPKFQSKGIGTKLMEYTLDYIRKENVYYIYFILTENDNIKACRLYQKFANRDEQVLFSNKI